MTVPQPNAASPSMDRVRLALRNLGLDQVEVREFAASTTTAADAAAAIGTTVDRIVKSLVFMAGDRPILVLELTRIAGGRPEDVIQVA